MQKNRTADLSAAERKRDDAETAGRTADAEPENCFQMGVRSFPKLKKLPKTHAYITSNMKIKDLLEVSLWLRT